MILVGIEETDDKEDIDWLCKKIVNLRVFLFDDENGVMNKSILDINGDILVISQFTLHASTKKVIVLLYPGSETGNFCSVVRTILQRIEFSIR